MVNSLYKTRLRKCPFPAVHGSSNTFCQTDARTCLPHSPAAAKLIEVRRSDARCPLDAGRVVPFYPAQVPHAQ